MNCSDFENIEYNKGKNNMIDWNKFMKICLVILAIFSLIAQSFYLEQTPLGFSSPSYERMMIYSLLTIIWLDLHNIEKQLKEVQND